MINTRITYTYEIVLVDEAARCMEVIYTSEKYGTRRVGARLPFEGEPLERVIRMFSPVNEWRLSELKVQVPEIHSSGAITDTLIDNVNVYDDEANTEVYDSIIDVVDVSE
jgi:hypothetical protein